MSVNVRPRTNSSGFSKNQILTILAALSEANDLCSLLPADNKLAPLWAGRLLESDFSWFPVDTLSPPFSSLIDNFATETTDDRANGIDSADGNVVDDSFLGNVFPKSEAVVMTVGAFNFDISTVKNGGAQNGGIGDNDVTVEGACFGPTV